MCGVCGKSFALQCNLKAHIKLHIQYKRPMDGVSKTDCVLQQQKNVFDDPYSFQYQRSVFYNSALNFGFERMFPFNQKFFVQFNSNEKV